MRNKGITLISLVITIIVLLILAAISIQTLSGNNGVLNNAITAKTATEISGEREIVSRSTVQAMGKNKYGNLVYSEYKLILDGNSNNGIELEEDGKEFYITFINSQRMYTVDSEGNITYLGSYEDLVNSATITATPESETSPKLVQTANVTVTTMLAKKDDEVFIHYGWSSDENTEPSEYAVATYTTESSKKRIATIISEDTNAGNY